MLSYHRKYRLTRRCKGREKHIRAHKTLLMALGTVPKQGISFFHSTCSWRSRHRATGSALPSFPVDQLWPQILYNISKSDTRHTYVLTITIVSGPSSFSRVHGCIGKPLRIRLDLCRCKQPDHSDHSVLCRVDLAYDWLSSPILGCLGLLTSPVYVMCWLTIGRFRLQDKPWQGTTTYCKAIHFLGPQHLNLREAYLGFHPHHGEPDVASQHFHPKF
ncbi:hypothetical protein GGR54DRAFT_47099 [Hypoxylon sp. NC1633]|nr:hypothetical protein GGR54DRAFT_47099 [Hypoxylon sp. NC1633]